MSHRIINKITDPDDVISQQLQLYKTPATIRDLETVFLYFQISADTTIKHPAVMNNPKNYAPQPAYGEYEPPNPMIDVNSVEPLDMAYEVLKTQNPYFAPIGTKRPFRIGEQINSLLDLRFPKDKYVIEINLVEAQLECSTDNWTNISEIIAIDNDTTATRTYRPVYKPKYEYLDPSLNIQLDANTGRPTNVIPDRPAKNALEGRAKIVPRRQRYLVAYDQAQKQTNPQSMYLRINGVDNGQPYNWSVSNNGEISVDKSHLLVLRHGDINYSNLELEFGHLVFTGRDQVYYNYLTDFNRATSTNTTTAPLTLGPGEFSGSKPLGEIPMHDRYQYLDYNQEWFNRSPLTASDNSNDKFVYPSERSGAQQLSLPMYSDFGIYGYNPPNSLTGGTKINRYRDDQLIEESNQYVQVPPMKFNQQLSNMILRFSVKIVHLF